MTDSAKQWIPVNRIFHGRGEFPIAYFNRKRYNFGHYKTSILDGVNGMDVNIPDEHLERLASEKSFKGDYSEKVVDMFRQTLQIIAAASRESDLEEFQCLKYRRIRGRGSRRRLALTDDTDLVVKLQNGKSKPKVIVEKISYDGRKKI